MIGLTIINLTILLIIDNTIGRITIGRTIIDNIIINLTIGHAIIGPIITDLTATNLKNALRKQ